MNEKIEEYIGDGVYASFDGYHIVLDLRAQDASRIALEPLVFDALLRFRDRVATVKLTATTEGEGGA